MTWVILQGDARRIPLADESVHCIVTSPPYYGLRDYGIEPSVWGGREDCGHEWVDHLQPAANGLVNNTMQGETLSGRSATRTPKLSAFCSRCSAWRGVLGLEPTPELYVQHIVEIFREVKRVLRKDGMCFINLGDSYTTGASTAPRASDPKAAADLSRGIARIGTPVGLKAKDLCGIPWRVAFALQQDGWWLRSCIVWAKAMSFHDCGNSPEIVTSTDLFGEEVEEIIEPEEENRSGSAMSESLNGWRWERHRVKVRASGQAGQGYTRMFNNIHNLPNIQNQPQAQWADCPGCPKCEANDGLILRKASWRPTTAHEFVFMLTKSEDYFGDAEAVREVATRERSGNTERKLKIPTRPNDHRGSSILWENNGNGRNLRSVWQINPQPLACSLCSICGRYWDKDGPAKHCGEKVIGHFATFPEALVEVCIKAGTSEKGVCAKCEAPWVRVIEKDKGIDPSPGQRFVGDGLSGWQSGPGAHDRIPKGRYGGKWAETDPQSSGRRIAINTKAARDNGGDHDNPFPPQRTVGWKASCKCRTEDRRPAVVLDLFAGAGTTPFVADKLGRIGVGMDLKWDYCVMTRRRIIDDAPLLADGLNSHDRITSDNDVSSS